MKMEENELFPIVSPIGYPAQKKSVLEQIMRKTTKADARLPWKELFFKNDLHTALSEKEAGEYVFPLEMLRQAPSASVPDTTRGVHWNSCRWSVISACFPDCVPDRTPGLPERRKSAGV